MPQADNMPATRMAERTGAVRSGFIFMITSDLREPGALRQAVKDAVIVFAVRGRPKPESGHAAMAPCLHGGKVRQESPDPGRWRDSVA